MVINIQIRAAFEFAVQEQRVIVKKLNLQSFVPIWLNKEQEVFSKDKPFLYYSYEYIQVLIF